MDKFEAAVASTKISLRSELILDGQPASAINYPDRIPTEIEFSRKDLAPLMTQRDRLVRLIYHEFLGILRIERSREYHLSIDLNAAAIIHKVDLANGNVVPTRLVSVDMSAPAPGFFSPMLGPAAQYQCSHFEHRGILNYSCGAAYLRTEALIGLQVLKFGCPYSITEKELQSLGPSVSWAVPIKVSAKFSAVTSSLMVTWTAEFQKLDSLGTNFEISDELFRKVVNTCKAKILLYPSDESED